MKDQFSLEDSQEAIRLRSAWQGVMGRLKAEIPPAWFQRYIRPLKPVGLTDGVAHIRAPGRFVCEWVRERYGLKIQISLSDELGEQVQVLLTAEPRERGEVEAEPEYVAPAPVSVARERDAFVPNDKFTFENYVEGQSNRLALAGARGVVQSPGKRFNPLFIYGPPGLGKTHLLHAIAHGILEKDPKVGVVLITAQQFAEDFVTSLQTNRMEQFRRSQRSVDVWLIDDIQFVAGKDKTCEEFFHLYNHLHAIGRQIVITSDRPPRDLYLMDERLRSRFEAGLVTDVQMPDTETRCAIVLSKARQEAVDLPLPTAMVLAERVPGNIRQLEGALTRFLTVASIEGSPLDEEFVQQFCDKYYPPGVTAKPSCDQIVKLVGDHFKIAPDEIKGTSRKAPIVHARHVAVYITRELTGDSWKHIGTLFGDRDHTSMMHGYQKISEMLLSDRELKIAVKGLMQSLRPY